MSGLDQEGKGGIACNQLRNIDDWKDGNSDSCSTTPLLNRPMGGERVGRRAT